MSNFPDDFASMAQGSPFAPCLTREASDFHTVSDKVRDAWADIDGAMDGAFSGDDARLDDFDTARLEIVLDLLRKAKAALAEVERHL